MQVRILSSLNTNFCYLLHDGTQACLVDPGQSEPAAAALRELRLTLSLILATHHHADHTSGIAALTRKTPCAIVGGGRISGGARILTDGEQVEFAGLSMTVLSTPGHTQDSVCFHAPSAGWLFTGDTLFAGGCGRLKEGTAAQMWSSLLRLNALPDATTVFGGHDYTEENYAFGLQVEPGNPAIRAALDAARKRRASGGPFTPTTLGEERSSNVFLRSGRLETFADRRQRKDTFSL